MWRVGDNACKIALPGNINTSVSLNVGDVTPDIEDKDEGIEDLRENPFQVGDVVVEQATQASLRTHIKTLVIGPKMA